jgi:orotate phosphoribosyltransferase-like protein
VRDLLEIPQEHLLQEQVQTVVLLEPQGSDDILEVPIEHLLQEVARTTRCWSLCRSWCC